MTNATVLISGAGIAGTALAYWLRRHGFKPTVVERAPEIRDGGYKVDIRGAALEVVTRMGLREDIRKHRTDVRGGSVVNAMRQARGQHGRGHLRRPAGRGRGDPAR